MAITRKARAQILLLVLLAAAALASCAPQEADVIVEGGDPDRGAQAIQRHGCHSCHTIPGIAGANSYVGPPLNAWSMRSYIAGALSNTPENLILWIMDPQAIEPGTAMPDMDISQQEAQDIAAYLFTLNNGGLKSIFTGGQ